MPIKDPVLGQHVHLVQLSVASGLDQAMFPNCIEINFGLLLVPRTVSLHYQKSQSRCMETRFYAPGLTFLSGQLDKLTSWCPKRFADLQIEGHASAGQITASIFSTVSEDLGPTPPNQDLTKMVRRIQERDTEWRHKNTSEFPGPTKGARYSQYRSYVGDSYRALVKEKQRTFIETLPAD